MKLTETTCAAVATTIQGGLTGSLGSVIGMVFPPPGGFTGAVGFGHPPLGAMRVGIHSTLG
jgi:hypothetical protein